jgi:hypothetical protein
MPVLSPSLAVKVHVTCWPVWLGFGLQLTLGVLGATLATTLTLVVPGLEVRAGFPLSVAVTLTVRVAGVV